MKLKFGLDGYLQPTPAKAKKIGLFCKAVAGSAVPTLLIGSHAIAIGLFLIGIAGEFFTNFYVDEDK